MFGYISVNKSEMKFKEFDIYHSYYCGLCQTLKKRYGALGQMSLSYDMTFILMLLTELYEPETKVDECRCIAHPFEKHVTRSNFLTEYVADMNVLFTCYKCQDDWEDEKKAFQLMYGIALEGKNKKRKAQYQKKADRISMLMHDFSAAEKRGETDIDTMAGIFGEVMAQIVVCREDEWSETLGRFGFFLGKFIYLMDAYEDIERDIRKNNYNPLKKWYREPDFEEKCKTILTMMMSECCREFEKLPIIENVDILRNILYSGVWCRFEQVRNARQINAEKETKRKEETEMSKRENKSGRSEV